MHRRRRGSELVTQVQAQPGKLASKDRASVSQVIVDLELWDLEIGFSAGERRMLDKSLGVAPALEQRVAAVPSGPLQR